MSDNREEYVFPQDVIWNKGIEEKPIREGGMTLLDWFAGQALTGIASTLMEAGALSIENAAELAYQLAKYMMNEREKQRENLESTSESLSEYSLRQTAS